MERVLAQIKCGRAILFVPTIRIGQAVQQGLAAIGLELEFFHAKAGTANWRDNVQGRFDGQIEPAIRSIIATSAFGMELDDPDIRLVVHWQHPFSVEEYLQGFGRAGRDGKPSLALLFHDPANDKGLLDYMLNRQEGGDLAARQRDLETIHRLVLERGTCFRKGLLDQMSGTSRKRISWAMRLLKWALELRQRSHKSASCCDGCDRRLPDLIKAGNVERLLES